MTETCKYCLGTFEVPEGMVARTERTMDMPPPAKVATWLVPRGQALPNWDGEPIHQCRKGKEVLGDVAQR